MEYETFASSHSGGLTGSMDKKKIAVAIVGVSLVVAIIVVIAVAAQPSDPAQATSATCPADYVEQPPVIVVSMDGFRANYRDRGLTPVLQQMADEGVSASYMLPSYPTVTFPNHYTIVTGLYPESHGIIANKFYDPEFSEVFSLGSATSTLGKWWLGEPMWNTLTRQGKKSATYFWPGSDANITGLYPTYWKPYDGSVPYEERVDQTLEWVRMPAEDRPAWITLYFEEPDKAGHEYGPDSDEVNAKLVVVDSLLERLIAGLDESNLLGCVNLLLLTDHGMASGGQSWHINLEDYITNVYDKSYVFTGAFARVDPKNESVEVRHEMMRSLACQRSDMRQYEKEGLPTRFHFSNNRRIEDIVLDLDAGRIAAVDSSWFNLGNHGYDNYFPAMNGMFVAHGPAFKTGVTVPPFQNIQLYNLMCYLTGVEPAPNNGTWGALNALLLTPAPVSELPMEDPPPVGQYPDAATLPKRLQVSGCPGDLTEEEPWLSSLQLTAEEQTAAEAHHLPFGLPHSGNLSADAILLHQTDHVTAYSARLKMPLWSSFTLVQAPDGGSRIANWSSDVRLDKRNSVRCDDYDSLDNNTIMAPLFPPEFSSNRSLQQVPYIVSNAAPSSEQQQKRWLELMDEQVMRWLGGSQLNVIVGPVFDINADSIVDNITELQRAPELPSDWFAVVTRCTTGGDIAACDGSRLDTRAFIFPTVQAVDNCLESAGYALEFSSTVKDVEIVTGLTLFTSLSPENRTSIVTATHSTLW